MHNRDNQSMLHRVEEYQILRWDVGVTEARTINESIQKHLGAGGIWESRGLKQELRWGP